VREIRDFEAQAVVWPDSNTVLSQILVENHCNWTSDKSGPVWIHDKTGKVLYHSDNIGYPAIAQDVKIWLLASNSTPYLFDFNQYANVRSGSALFSRNGRGPYLVRDGYKYVSSWSTEPQKGSTTHSSH
jgi:hypothetical protein